MSHQTYGWIPQLLWKNFFDPGSGFLSGFWFLYFWWLYRKNFHVEIFLLLTDSFAYKIFWKVRGPVFCLVSGFWWLFQNIEKKLNLNYLYSTNFSRAFQKLQIFPAFFIDVAHYCSLTMWGTIVSNLCKVGQKFRKCMSHLVNTNTLYTIISRKKTQFTKCPILTLDGSVRSMALVCLFYQFFFFH